MTEFLIPVQVPVLSDRLVIQFFVNDGNLFGSDTMFGSLVMSVKKLIAQATGDGYTYW